MLSNIGVPGLVLVINIILGIVGLFILYKVISAAVKDGINKSVVGKFIEKKDEFSEGKKSFLDSDLDNDK
ncbi:hypothetical protein [Bacillus benzoevorans]|uniref:Uncharacterized protein n=1 Tax=Bacillus benzoevorans TaxID=1456 RepID=A0A7X0HPE1_9BACI|nr:hypothetical protein [Bacillus benzoevorans]MBB6444533.1 hypothetical protein [Bacillus benzoevorans]